ncbi:AraC family transcriptional regulator [Rhizobium sp. 13T]|uniref:AraC family transcriptional regulator n=1 Tax=Rhizobium croatiense TaxID=2867516 RepID=A0ABS7M8A4_9HYPH|nr:AraC family transcriptional regulator [Rhizobium croatiense]
MCTPKHTSFHHHFRVVTSLSPLQFQKQLRLIEARRMMISEGAPISNAAYAVGYESVPQFTREYGRLFGSSPARDVRESFGRPRSRHETAITPTSTHLSMHRLGSRRSAARELKMGNVHIALFRLMLRRWHTEYAPIFS